MGPASAPARGTPVARILPWAIAAATSALAAVALFEWAPWRDAQVLRPVVFDIPAAGPAAYMSISPDGQKIVYAANPETEARNVPWLRALDRSAPIRLQGTEGATSADWSPDSRLVIYATQNRLLKLDVSGGPPQALSLLPNSSLYQRATWNRRGDIVFSAGGRLHHVRDSGGELIELSQLDATLEEAYHATPWFLPDGRRFLYSAWSSNPERRSIYVGSLDGSPRVRLMHSEGKVMYAGGRLVFVRAGTLVVQPFDPDNLTLSGEPIPLVEQVAFNTDTGAAAFHVSENGTLIYRRGGGLLATTRELVWIGRDGRRGTPLGLETSSPSIALSPDGKKLATFESPQAVSSDIWIIDLERGVRTRLTNDAATDSFPVWSPDGADIIFYSNRGGRGGLFRKPASGATAERPLLVGDFAESMRPRGWSTDGRSLMVERAPFGAVVVRDLVVLDMPGNEAAPRERRYVTTPFDEGHAAVSPDGRWVAYVSNEPGTYQVFVQPFPDAAGGKWQISTRGGLAPRWRRDSKELYYIRRDGMLVAVPVGSGAGSDFSPGRETVLFPFPFGYSEGQLPDPAVPYDVSPDGERFLMSVPATASSSTTSAAPISVILNWPALLQPR